MNSLRIAASVAAVGLAVVILYRVSSDQPKPQFAQPSTELMSRAVTTCDQLAREIEDITQTTAELRKVLRDMEYLTCALPNSKPKETVIDPGPKPDCSPGEAVPYYGTWTCVSVPK